MLLVTLITAQPMHTCQKPTMPPCQKQKKTKRFSEVQINSITPSILLNKHITHHASVFCC